MRLLLRSWLVSLNFRRANKYIFSRFVVVVGNRIIRMMESGTQTEQTMNRELNGDAACILSPGKTIYFFFLPLPTHDIDLFLISNKSNEYMNTAVKR